MAAPGHLVVASSLRTVGDPELDIHVRIVDSDDEQAMRTQRAERNARRRQCAKRKRDHLNGKVVSWNLRTRPGALACTESHPPDLDHSDQDVAPHNGIITLTGHALPSSKKHRAPPGTLPPTQLHHQPPLFNLLPDEMLIAILAHLPAQHRLPCAAISRRWHRLILDPLIWTELDFSGYDYVSDAVLRRLTAAPRALRLTRSLSLRKCHKVTDEAVRFIAQSSMSVSLSRLDLSWCAGATDRSVVEFARCGNLREVSVGHNRSVTGRSIRILVANCPQLEVLDLRCCGSLSNATVENIAMFCPRLRVVNFSSAVFLTNCAVGILVRSCRNLERLDLSWCLRISDEALFDIGENLTDLIDIGLSETSVGSLGVSYLARGCPKLQVIQLGRCKYIDDQAVQEIENRLSGSLRQLNVASCREIHTEVIESLMANCLQLKILDVSMLPCRDLNDALERYAVPRGIEVFH